MSGDPRAAAVAALFVLREEGERMVALTLPEIPSGGWAWPGDPGVPVQEPYGLRARVEGVRDALVGLILAKVDEASPGNAPCEECGGKGRWHGELGPAECWRCYGSGRAGGPVRDPGAVLAGIVRAEEHERATLVRERDEALAARDTIARDRAEANEEIDYWKGLFHDAKTRADAARAEARALAERIAALEAEVARLRPPAPRQLAIPGCEPAATLPPLPDAYKPKARRCGKCGEFGHNARTCDVREAKGAP